MKVTVFRHTISHGVGTFGHALERTGCRYHYVDTFHEDISCFNALEPDLLIVMGGAPGAYQDDLYPFLRQEMDILEQRLARDLPTLGVCLGAQMMARVLGADVYPGTNGKEKGWFPIRVTEEGMNTPVRHLDQSLTMMAQWHGDTFDLPEGAVLLATGDLYENQIYSWGKNALGLQCHSEATPHIIKSWFVSSVADVMEGHINLPQLREETDRYISALMTQTDKFMSEWLAQVMPSGKDKEHA